MQSQKKRIRHRYRNYIIYVLAFLVVLTGVLGTSKSSTVLAAEGGLKKGNISFVCPVEGMKLSLYRVAEYEESGNFTLTEQFGKYPVSLEQKSQDGWQDVANALADYIRRDRIKADASAVSGSDRRGTFTNLTRGLYLVIGQTTEKQEDGKTQVYEPQVALIALPDDLQGNLEGADPYDVTAILKFEKNEKPAEAKTKLHVLKVWKGDKEEKRPTSVKVDLLKIEADGSTTVADSRILNQENQWSYTWENLSTEVRWSAVESQVPAGYYVSTVRTENTIVVTNTAKQPVSDKNNTQDQSKKTGAKLPQTGQLWWPVLVLLLAGIICIVVGCSFSRKKSKKIDK